MTKKLKLIVFFPELKKIQNKINWFIKVQIKLLLNFKKNQHIKKLINRFETIIDKIVKTQE